MSTTHTLKKQVLRLDKKNRIDLTLRLLESLESDLESDDTSDVWIEEAESRYQAWKKGEIKTISEAEVLTRVKKHLKK